jgi:pimeloyl-ACP methyl ester carboxylesterase
MPVKSWITTTPGHGGGADGTAQYAGMSPCSVRICTSDVTCTCRSVRHNPRVAHRGAAAPATVALDRHVEEVDHVVWADTAPVADGYAIDPDAGGIEHPLSAQYDEELEQGSMAGLSEEQLAAFRERAVPQPASSMRDAVSLADERRLDVPGTIVCTAFAAADYRSYAEQGTPFLNGLLQHRRLELVDLPTGHWPMWSKPAELADIIAQATAGDA